MYLAMKSLHILAVVIFLGNILTGAFWKAHADKSGDPRIMAHTLDGIIRSDRLFTIPGVVLIVIFGVAAAIFGHFPILGTGWILHGIILLTISGVAFMFKVAPLQRQLRDVAQAGVATGKLDNQAYRRSTIQWTLWGSVASLAPIAALVLMVLKHPG